MNLIKYLRHVKTVDKLPRLPRMYSTDYETSELEEEEAQLMKITAVRSPQGARILERKFKADAKSLASSLPIVPFRRKRDRVLPLIRKILGVLPYDPLQGDYRRHRAREKKK